MPNSVPLQAAHLSAKLAPWMLSMLFLGALAPAAPLDQASQPKPTHVVHAAIDIELTSDQEYAWWTFPVEAEFIHEESSQALKLKAFWDGEGRWILRFAPPAPGTWTYRSISSDPRLDGVRGSLVARSATVEEISANRNLRGQIRIREDNRHFEYADGTPCLLLADTLWSGNTLRCGLGDQNNGPFFTYLKDRREKGFTAVLMRFLSGFGDEPNNFAGHRNEGGYLFVEGNLEQLNPAYFASLDERMTALTNAGLLPVMPITWWGKTKDKFCPIELDVALRLTRYLAARYGAYNGIWCLSGEYQYAFRDCGWTTEDFNRMGRAMAEIDAYDHPLSIHPSGLTSWDAPHGAQSSRAFHHSGWLDHHWVQTGQSFDRMHNSVVRAVELRDLSPEMPVFCSEGFYEQAGDEAHAYHARWQMWTAMLNGYAGYGYGAWGMFQFYDPDFPGGETGGFSTKSVPWSEAMELEGAGDMLHVRRTLEDIEWWRLQPSRDLLQVNGKPVGVPSSSDISPPHCATIGDELWIVYIPQGNGGNTIGLKETALSTARLTWIDPRTGEQHSSTILQTGNSWVLPERPHSAAEDWVAKIEIVR